MLDITLLDLPALKRLNRILYDRAHLGGYLLVHSLGDLLVHLCRLHLVLLHRTLLVNYTLLLQSLLHGIHAVFERLHHRLQLFFLVLLSSLVILNKLAFD